MIQRPGPQDSGRLVTVIFLTPPHEGAVVATSPIAKHLTVRDGGKHPVPGREDFYEQLAFPPPPVPGGDAAQRKYASWVVTHETHTQFELLKNNAQGKQLGAQAAPTLAFYVGAGGPVVVSPSVPAGGVHREGVLSMSERWVELLGTILDDHDRAATVESRALEDPAGLLEELRVLTEDEQQRGEISALLAALAEADTVASMEQWFVDRASAWAPVHRRSGALGAEAVGVEWTYEGSYARDRTFHGAPARDQPVEAHGFTIFGVERRRLVVYRHIDWAGLFAQIGFTLNTRIPVPPPTDEELAAAVREHGG